MKRFEGKKLLELGTTMGSVQMVEYAKENGCICEKQPLSKVEDGHYIACNHYEENEIQV